MSTSHLAPPSRRTPSPIVLLFHHGPDRRCFAPVHPAFASPPPGPRRHRRLWITGGLAVVVVLAALAWYRWSLCTVSTDDAYVNGHVTFVAPRVGGQVVAVLVDDNNRVHQGDLLVRLDPEKLDGIGMMGMHGQAWVNHTIQDADLLIALGMRFDDRVTGNLKTYAPKAKKIQVEIDPTEINKNVKVDVALIGDLRAVLRDLLPHLQPIDCSDWRDYIDGIKGDAAVRDIQNLPDSGHLYAAHVINDLWQEPAAPTPS